MRMKKLILLPILCLVMYACHMSEEPIDVIDPDSISEFNETAEVYVKSGFLVFQSNSVLQETLESFKSMEVEDKIGWSQNLPGFSSMLDIYNQAMIQDAILGEKIINGGKEFENLRESDIKEGQVVHSQFTNENLEHFIQYSDGGIDMDIFRYDVAAVVNIDGLVQVGDYLFQYTRDHFKMIENPKDSDIKKMLDITETNFEIGMTVHDVNHQVLTNYEGSRTYFEGECTSSRFFGPYNDGLFQENTVSLNTTSYPIFELFPCGHPACEGECFRQDCEVLTGYESHQTFQIRSWGRIKFCMGSVFGKLFCVNLNVSMTHTQFGSYEFNRIPRDYYFKSTTPLVFAENTLYSGTAGDITRANLHFKGCGKSNCGDWDNCSISF